AGAFDQLDAFCDGGMGRNAVKIAQLKDDQTKGNADFQVELRLRTAGEMGDQKIELALVPETAEYQGLGQSGIAGFQRDGLTAQQVRSIAPGVDFGQDAKGDFSRGGNGSHGLRSA